MVEMLIEERCRLLFSYFGPTLAPPAVAGVLTRANAQVGSNCLLPKFLAWDPDDEEYSDLSIFPMSCFVFGPHGSVKGIPDNDLPPIESITKVGHMNVGDVPAVNWNSNRITNLRKSDFLPRGDKQRAWDAVVEVLMGSNESRAGQNAC